MVDLGDGPGSVPSPRVGDALTIQRHITLYHIVHPHMTWVELYTLITSYKDPTISNCSIIYHKVYYNTTRHQILNHTESHIKFHVFNIKVLVAMLYAKTVKLHVTPSVNLTKCLETSSYI